MSGPAEIHERVAWAEPGEPAERATQAEPIDPAGLAAPTTSTEPREAAEPAEHDERLEAARQTVPAKRTPGTPPPFGRTVPGNRFDLVADVVPPARTVSVIVVHYAQQSELDRTLAALARQTYPADLVDVIVVDDGSPEPPRVPSGVTLLVQEDLGFRAGQARNLGAGHARGDILCFLDADTSPEPTYLERLVRLPSILPEAIVVGHRKHADFSGTAATEPVDVAGPAHELPEPSWLLDAYRDSRNLLDADDRSYRFVIGAAFACTAWFFAETGGFDDRFTRYGGEDWEWAHRGWLAGGILAHEPLAVAWHDGPDAALRARDATHRRAIENEETLRMSALIPVDGSRPRALLLPDAGTTDILAVLHDPADAEDPSNAPDSDADRPVVDRTADGPSGAALNEAAAVICVDSLLALLPQARVIVPASVAAPFAADPRVSVATSRAATAARSDTRVGDSDSDTIPTESDPELVSRLRIDIERGVRFDATPIDREPSASDRADTAHVDNERADASHATFHEALALAAEPGVLSVELGDHVRITSERSRHRAERWGDAAGLHTRHLDAEGVSVLPADARLAAYFGGWN